jgi:hypothetical protein
MHRQLVYYKPMEIRDVMRVVQPPITLDYVLRRTSVYLTKYVDDSAEEWIAEDEYMFYIKAGVLEQLKQYIEVIAGESMLEKDKINVKYVLNTQLKGKLPITIAVQLYNTLTNETKVDTKVIQNPGDEIGMMTFDGLIPGNRYAVKATAKLHLDPEVAIEEIKEILAVTKPKSFTHKETTIRRRTPSGTAFVVDWHYGCPDDNVNKDVDQYRVSVYDTIPRKSVWDYTDSPTEPTEIVSPDLEEDVAPLTVVSFTPGEASHSVDAHSFILDVGRADPEGERKATHYRWVEVEAYIVCDPDYLEYGFQEGEANGS